MEEINSPSIWNKKADDLTVGESVKTVVVVTVICAVVPIAIAAAVEGTGALVRKIKSRKAKKSEEKKDES